MATAAELREEAGVKRRVAAMLARFGPTMSLDRDRRSFADDARRLSAEASVLEVQADALDAEESE